MPEGPGETQYIVPEPIVFDLSPEGMAVFSSDIDVAMKAISPGRFSAAKYFLICLSIELALKSTLRSRGVSKEELEAAGHDLGKLLRRFVDCVDCEVITTSEGNLIRQMVRFYHKEAGSKKGLVYFERNMNIQALQAYKDLPDIKKLEKAHDKIQAYLKEYVFNLED